MHEISLVRNIFYTLEAEFPDRFRDIRKIYLTVGELSNVQPMLMQSAFDAVLEDEQKYRHTSLIINVLPIKIYCETCSKETQVQQYKFICSYCHAPSKHIVQGEEMLISKVEFEI